MSMPPPPACRRPRYATKPSTSGANAVCASENVAVMSGCCGAASTSSPTYFDSRTVPSKRPATPRLATVKARRSPSSETSCAACPTAPAAGMVTTTFGGASPSGGSTRKATKSEPGPAAISPMNIEGIGTDGGGGGGDCASATASERSVSMGGTVRGAGRRCGPQARRRLGVQRLERRRAGGTPAVHRTPTNGSTSGGPRDSRALSCRASRGRGGAERNEAEAHRRTRQSSFAPRPRADGTPAVHITGVGLASLGGRFLGLDGRDGRDGLRTAKRCSLQRKRSTRRLRSTGGERRLVSEWTCRRLSAIGGIRPRFYDASAVGLRHATRGAPCQSVSMS